MLSNAGRDHLLAQRYVEARKVVDTKLYAAAVKAKKDDAADADTVFGLKGLPGDRASLVISQRDAADRVDRIDPATGRDELVALLARATRSRDEVLARAVAERANETGDAELLDQFLADRPDLFDAASRLWQAERASNSPELQALANLDDTHVANFAQIAYVLPGVDLRPEADDDAQLLPPELAAKPAIAISQLAETPPEANSTPTGRQGAAELVLGMNSHGS